MTCGLCGSSICAEEKSKPLKGGGTARYVYYGCNRGKDRSCKNTYIREEDLVAQLAGIIDKVDLNELGVREKFEEEITRFNKFQTVLGGGGQAPGRAEVDVRAYAKYVLGGEHGGEAGAAVEPAEPPDVQGQDRHAGIRSA